MLRSLQYEQKTHKFIMKKSLILLVAAIFLVPAIYAGVSPYFYASEINWHSYKDARAMNSEKPIFVFASMRFCMTCAAMEKDVFTDPELAKLLNEHFIPVKETTNTLFSSFIFDDLKDQDNETLSFRGFPALMLVTGSKYSLSYGYKSAAELKNRLK